MSGVYNMIFGKNPAYPYLMGIVGINQENFGEFGRLRDVWINEEATMIGVFHRNYGEDGRPADEAAAALPTFQRKVLAESDGTYGWYEFGVPDEYQEFAQMVAEETDNRNCMDKYSELLSDMQAGRDNENMPAATEAARKVFQGLSYAMQEGVADVEHNGGGVNIQCSLGNEEGGDADGS